MADLFSGMHPVLQAFYATLFTWLVTALGAAVALFGREFSQRVMDGMLAFAGGVMTAASYWSLLAPSIEMAGHQGMITWLPPVVGFLLGGAFMRLIDVVLPHVHLTSPASEAEGPSTSWHRSVLLVLAVTLHNIPEGLAIGVAFGAVASGLPSATMAGAVALALGIGIQNFPEGFAVSMPLRREGLSRMKSLWYGQLSGIVELFAGVIGAAAVLLIRPLLPYALAFAAGAMIFVVVEEVVPEAERGGNTDMATMCFMIGFAVMMSLDVALG
ncbi:MAG: ZIP family metal transporter [Synergistales bacterium]|nr:ZIP family metal transporter [Synergistales bacterium]